MVDASMDHVMIFSESVMAYWIALMDTMNLAVSTKFVVMQLSLAYLNYFIDVCRTPI